MLAPLPHPLPKVKHEQHVIELSTEAALSAHEGTPTLTLTRTRTRTLTRTRTRTLNAGLLEPYAEATAEEMSLVQEVRSDPNPHLTLTRVQRPEPLPLRRPLRSASGVRAQAPHPGRISKKEY